MFLPGPISTRTIRVLVAFEYHDTVVLVVLLIVVLEMYTRARTVVFRSTSPAQDAIKSEFSVHAEARALVPYSSDYGGSEGVVLGALEKLQGALPRGVPTTKFTPPQSSLWHSPSPNATCIVLTRIGRS